MAAAKILCPNRRPGGGSCGTLEPIDGARMRRATRYRCTRCRRAWSARDVRALVAARAHVPVAARPEAADQPVLPGFGDDDRN